MPDDNLNFSIRLHDPAQKKDPTKSTAWFVRDVPRADLALTIDEFIEKYVKPAFLADLGKFFTLTNAAPAAVSLSDRSGNPASTAGGSDVQSPAAIAPDTPSPSPVVARDSAQTAQDLQATDLHTADSTSAVDKTPDPQANQ